MKSMLDVMHIEIHGFTEAKASKAANFIKEVAAKSGFKTTTEICLAKKIAGQMEVPHFRVFVSFIRTDTDAWERSRAAIKLLTNYKGLNFTQEIECRFFSKNG